MVFMNMGVMPTMLSSCPTLDEAPAEAKESKGTFLEKEALLICPEDAKALGEQEDGGLGKAPQAVLGEHVAHACPCLPSPLVTSGKNLSGEQGDQAETGQTTSDVSTQQRPGSLEMHPGAQGRRGASSAEVLAPPGQLAEVTPSLGQNQR